MNYVVKDHNHPTSKIPRVFFKFTFYYINNLKSKMTVSLTYPPLFSSLTRKPHVTYELTIIWLYGKLLYRLNTDNGAFNTSRYSPCQLGTQSASLSFCTSKTVVCGRCVLVQSVQLFHLTYPR